MKNLLTLFELSTEEILRVFAITKELKEQLISGIRKPVLAGHTLAMLFDKSSLRTRVSFETAMAQMGGTSLFLGSDVGWGKRESPADFSQVLGQYVDCIVCRTHAHSRIEVAAGVADTLGVDEQVRLGLRHDAAPEAWPDGWQSLQSSRR